MNVLYDHQIFSIQDFGGVSRYFHELLDHAGPGLSAELPVVLSNNLYLHDRRHTRHHEFFRHLPFRGRWRIIQYVNQQAARRALRRQNFDVFHPTLSSSPYFLDLLEAKPFVLTIHDMIERLFPQFYAEPDPGAAQELLCRRASRVIAVSEHTRADVLRLLKLPPECVEVIYHGYARREYQAAESRIAAPQNYLLYTGTRALYKNFSCLVEAFCQLTKREFPDLHLVCAGGHPFTSPEREMLRQAGIESRVHHFGMITDAQLQQLYRNARAFVFPSHYEGFGLPILEAFGQHCPVVLSQASCFPEIARDAALYFDPNQPEELRQQLRQLLHDADLRTHLARLGDLRVRDFTWQHTAARTRQVYEQARAAAPVFSH
ncbi:glycosyltransferase family 1 protein [Hymenobacter fastidiosus]|uniref:Glycosyltransferase family 1 protein n=1 Tax=Hymenobacter fastidiosus TaxID=486264 RepID=A0ABP7RBN0_9BACT